MRSIPAIRLFPVALGAILLAGGDPPPAAPEPAPGAGPAPAAAAEPSEALKAFTEFSRRLLSLELAEDQWNALAAEAVPAISVALETAPARAAFEKALPEASEGGRKRLEAAFLHASGPASLSDVQARHLRERLESIARGTLTEAQQAAVGALQPGKEIEQPKVVPYAGDAGPGGGASPESRPADGGEASRGEDRPATPPEAGDAPVPSGKSGAGKGKKGGGAKKKKKK